ncbi:Tobamovirus multiplication protein 1 [Vitis vinifera]|uniref:Tobamovirus multiplication protein 1 n=1 Tax=Vitis vinifera TaxID=29760 RepID=A0A438JGH5_VITVI|nr:Tobamovirus multiplication protein 1 [Vitis vinifera]
MREMPLGLDSLTRFIALASSWWDKINDSATWQDGIFYALCGAYALVSSVALGKAERVECGCLRWLRVSFVSLSVMRRRIGVRFVVQLLSLFGSGQLRLCVESVCLGERTIDAMYWICRNSQELFFTAIQLIRIELRVPEYGWTTQKVFHLMNFIVNGVRAIVFGFHKQVFVLHPKVSLLLFQGRIVPVKAYPSCPRDPKLEESHDVTCPFNSSTVLKGLFADSMHLHLEPVNRPANLIHQSRHQRFCLERVHYLVLHSRRHAVNSSPAWSRQEVCIWIYLWIDDNSVVEFIGSIFMAVISFIAALGFLLYGGRLDLLLAICFTCFLIRCFVVVLSAFDSDASLDVLSHPILNLIYYMLVEILPSALVLYILRKLPPKRISAQYHPIR